MKYACEQFDGKTNFGIWQSTVKDILVQQGLLKPLLGNKPESMDQDDWEELQAKAISTIRNPGHEKYRSKSRGKQDKSSIECWYCKEIGHIARKCPERKEKKNGKEHVNNANVAEEDDKSSDSDLYLVSSVEQQEDEPSLEDPEEHPSDSWNLVRDREPRTKKPTQSEATTNSEVFWNYLDIISSSCFATENVMSLIKETRNLGGAYANTAVIETKV
ncbi:hypothetical protein RJ640_010690 [Escallonia rubra]|uniref:CCHC-type domain-containing protein n=1 Tax=Escallonia rubra TaxID=112253 RepID=A0AA88S8I6_9ASTE|nr:hypothetical protein RJ640_010690 [Escallonia rubra]